MKKIYLSTLTVLLGYSVASCAPWDTNLEANPITKVELTNKENNLVVHRQSGDTTKFVFKSFGECSKKLTFVKDKETKVEYFADRGGMVTVRTDGKNKSMACKSFVLDEF